jgi:hypothetical protein
MRLLGRFISRWRDVRRSRQEVRMFGRIIDERAARRAGRPTL